MSEMNGEHPNSTLETLNSQGAATPWNLPSMGDPGKTIKPAKKEKKPQNEIIEDYKGRVKPKPMTADALKQMVDEAQKEGCEQGYQEGFQKGQAEGLQKGTMEGKSQAYQEAKAEFDQQIATLNGISQALMQPMLTQDERLENIIVEMAYRFSQQLVEDEIKANPSKLYRIVQKAISALPAGAKNIQIFLNEQDANLFESCVSKEQREWEVSIDKTLKSGGCRVETKESIVDYSLDSRFQKYLEQIKEKGDVSTTKPVENYRDALLEEAQNIAELLDSSSETEELNHSNQANVTAPTQETRNEDPTTGVQERAVDTSPKNPPLN